MQINIFLTYLIASLAAHDLTITSAQPSPVTVAPSKPTLFIDPAVVATAAQPTASAPVQAEAQTHMMNLFAAPSQVAPQTQVKDPALVAQITRFWSPAERALSRPATAPNVQIKAKKTEGKHPQAQDVNSTDLNPADSVESAITAEPAVTSQPLSQSAAVPASSNAAPQPAEEKPVSDSAAGKDEPKVADSEPELTSEAGLSFDGPEVMIRCGFASY